MEEPVASPKLRPADYKDDESYALEGGLWHLVAVSAAASANRPDYIAPVIQRRLDELSTLSDRVSFVRQTRETILKMTALTGVPKGIVALTALASAIPDGSRLAHELAATPATRGPADYNHEQIRARGKSFFAQVYRRHATTVENKLHALNPDLAEIVLVDTYGRLLSPTHYLSGRDTELCAIGSLVPQNVPVQLKSHCIGASRLGATESMIQAALRVAKMICTRRP